MDRLLYATCGEYITTEISGAKVMKLTKDVYYNEVVQASDLISVHKDIPSPEYLNEIITNLEGDAFAKGTSNVQFHFKDGWR